MVRLKYFFESVSLTTNELLSLPVDKIQDLLIDYIIKLRDKKLSHNYIKARLSPVSSFLEMNDVFINKKKIARFYGEQKKTVRDYAYTQEDIQKMLSLSSLRQKVIILIYASTGIRKSAILDLKVKHLENLDNFKLYKITVYENSKEEYYTFCTPECARAIDQYIEYRKQAGETISKETFLIRNNFDFNNKQQVKDPQPINYSSLVVQFRKLLINCGLRESGAEQFKRHEKALFHAFRKYFATNLANCDVNQLIKELLLGHSVGLDNSYYRPNENKMLSEYMKAIDTLTIDSSKRLERKMQLLQQEKNQIEMLELKHSSDMKKMDDKIEKLMIMYSQNPKLSNIKPKILRAKIRLD
jgi:integrase